MLGYCQFAAEDGGERCYMDYIGCLGKKGMTLKEKYDIKLFNP